MPQHKTILPCYDLQEVDGKTLLISVQQSLDFDPELVTSEDRQLFAEGNKTLRKPLEGVMIGHILEPVVYQWIAGVRAIPAIEHLKIVGGLQEVWFENQRFLFHFIESEKDYNVTSFVAVGFARMST